MAKQAIIIGSTGLTGGFLLELLTKSDYYEKIIAPVRNKLVSKNSKVNLIEVNFRKPQEMAAQLQGDCLFICVGTTMAKAGSQGAFLKVDYNIPVDIAHIAMQNKVKICIVVSSVGADANSGNFYLQTKGKMEQAIEKLGFETTVFMRPSILLGARKELRPGEIAGKFLMRIVKPFLVGSFRKYRGIEAHTVAAAMFHVAQSELKGIHKFENNQIEELATSKS
jgi:uncharacterized protein YbjT (DUF2867 family)